MRRLETPQYSFALRDEPHLRALFDRALQQPRPGSQDPRVELRNAVSAFVRRSRAEGQQVETIIVAIKDIMGVPDRPSRSLAGDDDAPAALLLARRVVTWCIQDYYGPSGDVPV